MIILYIIYRLDGRLIIFHFRVDGLMMNTKSFNEAFECPAGSRMNPQTKCGIWTN